MIPRPSKATLDALILVVLAITALLVLFVDRACAQTSTPLRISQSTTAVLSLLDAETTRRGYAAGYGDANPLAPRSPVRLYVLKSSVAAALILYSHCDAKVHPKRALWGSIVINAVQAVVVIRNARIIRKG